MLSRLDSLLTVALLVSAFSAGCGSDSSEESKAPDAGADTLTTADEGPRDGAGSDSAVTPDTAVATDSAVASDATGETDVTLELQAATFESSAASGGGFVHTVAFSIVNTSSTPVTSLETMVFDFGGGDTVQLTAPACSGSFPIAPGAKRLVDTQVVVSTSGSLTNFSFVCGGTQRFGGASGSAPPDARFGGPLTITVGGKTSSGTFTATGNALGA